MYVYKQSEANLYTVGFFAPDVNWGSESDWDTPEEAAKRVNYLNGGDARISLERAALMIAQGFSTFYNSHPDLSQRQNLAKYSVLIAKAVIEEANK